MKEQGAAAASWLRLHSHQSSHNGGGSSGYQQSQQQQNQRNSYQQQSNAMNSRRSYAHANGHYIPTPVQIYDDAYDYGMHLPQPNPQLRQDVPDYRKVIADEAGMAPYSAAAAMKARGRLVLSHDPRAKDANELNERFQHVGPPLLPTIRAKIKQALGNPMTAADLMREGPRDYKVIRSLGDGSFGTVFLADWKSPLPDSAQTSLMQRQKEKAKPEYEGKRLVAIKKMKKAYKNWKECLTLKELKSLLAIPSHPNIIELYDSFLMPGSKELHFVFECMEGNLYQLTKTRRGRPLANGLVASIFLQMTQGLDHIHAHGYFHRDLKPENLLLTTMGLADYPMSRKRDGVERDVNVLLKIADFGLARETASKPPYTEYVSTRWYRAPEVLLRARNYSNPVDTWAVGTIMAEVATLRPLFPGSSEVTQVLQICEVLGTPSDEWGIDHNGEPRGGGAWEEGHKMARAVGFQWPQCEPIVFGNFFSRATPVRLVSVIHGLLRYDPAKRFTTKDCLEHDYFTKDITFLNQPVSVEDRDLSDSGGEEELDERDKTAIRNSLQAGLEPPRNLPPSHAHSQHVPKPEFGATSPQVLHASIPNAIADAAAKLEGSHPPPDDVSIHRRPFYWQDQQQQLALEEERARQEQEQLLLQQQRQREQEQLEQERQEQERLRLRQEEEQRALEQAQLQAQQQREAQEREEAVQMLRERELQEQQQQQRQMHEAYLASTAPSQDSYVLPRVARQPFVAQQQMPVEMEIPTVDVQPVQADEVQQEPQVEMGVALGEPFDLSRRMSTTSISEHEPKTSTIYDVDLDLESRDYLPALNVEPKSPSLQGSLPSQYNPTNSSISGGSSEKVGQVSPSKLASTSLESMDSSEKRKRSAWSSRIFKERKSSESGSVIPQLASQIGSSSSVRLRPQDVDSDNLVEELDEDGVPKKVVYDADGYIVDGPKQNSQRFRARGVLTVPESGVILSRGEVQADLMDEIAGNAVPALGAAQIFSSAMAHMIDEDSDDDWNPFPDTDSASSSQWDIQRQRKRMTAASIKSYRTGDSDPGPPQAPQLPPGLRRGGSATTFDSGASILDGRLRYTHSHAPQTGDRGSETRSINSVDQQLAADFGGMLGRERANTSSSGLPFAVAVARRQSNEAGRQSRGNSALRDGSASPMHRPPGSARFHPYGLGMGPGSDRPVSRTSSTGIASPRNSNHYKLPPIINDHRTRSQRGLSASSVRPWDSASNLYAAGAHQSPAGNSPVREREHSGPQMGFGQTQFSRSATQLPDPRLNGHGSHALRNEYPTHHYKGLPPHEYLPGQVPSLPSFAELTASVGGATNGAAADGGLRPPYHLGLGDSLMDYKTTQGPEYSM